MDNNLTLNTLLADHNHLALDKQDRVISIGKNRYEELGIKSDTDVIGKSLFEILKNAGGAPDAFMQQKEEIKRQAFAGELDETWILVSNRFAHNHELHITHIKTMRDQEQHPIGCIITPRKFTLYGQSPKLTIPENPKLTVRQNEIIFLLAIGMTQKEIANLYQINRGTVVKSIGVICTKFDFAGANENKLIELAYNHGYGIPPYHLLNTGLFQFNTPYISNYHLRKFLFHKNT